LVKYTRQREDRLASPGGLSNGLLRRLTRPKMRKPIESPGRYVPAAPLGLAALDATDVGAQRACSSTRTRSRAGW